MGSYSSIDFRGLFPSILVSAISTEQKPFLVDVADLHETSAHGPFYSSSRGRESDW